MNSNINSEKTTIFSNSSLGISMRGKWIEQHLNLLVSETLHSNSELVMIIPEKVENEILASVHFHKIHEFKNGEINFDNKKADSVISFYEEHKGPNNLVLIFWCDNQKMMHYCCKYNHQIDSSIESNSLYRVQNNELIVEFELIKWLFEFCDGDITLLRSLTYIPVKETIKDLQGELRELDPILMSLNDFINGNMLVLKNSNINISSSNLGLSDINMLQPSTLERNIAQAKSIFKKLNPEAYKYFYEDAESIDKAS